MQKRPVQPESNPHLGAQQGVREGAWLDGAGLGSGSPPPSPERVWDGAPG